MNVRAVLRIGSVLVVALMAALLLRGLFLASTAEPPPPETASIQVANSNLPMGLLLKAEDMAWKEVPVDKVQPGDIRKDTPQAGKLLGAVLRHPIDEGQAIREKDVVFPDSPGFLAAALKPGMRAVSVAIDDVTGNAGLIQPGDYVDLVLTHELDREETGPEGNKVASETVLSDMRVIAVGQSLRFTESDPNKNQGIQHSARTVTLEVQPRDAEKVAVATRLGQLSLALRSLATPRPEEQSATQAADQQAAPMWGTDVSAVVRMTAEEKPHTERPTVHSAPAAPKIQVFRGSGRSSDGGSSASALAPLSAQ